MLQKTLNELLNKGFIKVSNSPVAAPVLFVRKSESSLCFCVNYQALNKLTRKDWYLLPLIQKTLRNLSKTKVFIKLNVITAFHHLRIKEGNK